MNERIEAILERYDSLTAEMAKPEVIGDYKQLETLARERAALEEVVQLVAALRKVLQQAEDARSLILESSDEEIVRLAREELAELEPEQARLEGAVRRALLPRDPMDSRNVIVEIRAGTGGDEAALFAADLYRMYQRYAEQKGWPVEVISASANDLGGFREIIFEVRGDGAYSRLKHESGAHRVQRVPVTEASGRIHTSTATVAVLPEAEEVDVEVNEKDLRIDIYHSGGAGGQNVNKVATAVRITHLPTGIVVQCQDERSQLKNRVKAMSVLRSRLLAAKQEEQTAQIGDSRRAQVGTGERADKIRTYNFPQDRVTDHRIGYSRHNLPGFLNGDLDELIDGLISAEEAARLQESVR
jgi:peptide chain release factor 1